MGRVDRGELFSGKGCADDVSCADFLRETGCCAARHTTTPAVAPPLDEQLLESLQVQEAPWAARGDVRSVRWNMEAPHHYEDGTAIAVDEKDGLTYAANECNVLAEGTGSAVVRRVRGVVRFLGRIEETDYDTFGPEQDNDPDLRRRGAVKACFAMRPMRA